MFANDLSVFALVFLSFVAGSSFQRPRLEIEPKSPVCLRKVGNLHLKCLMHVNPANLSSPFVTQDLSLKWYLNGQLFPSFSVLVQENFTLISRITTNRTGLYSCVGQIVLWSSEFLNRSVMVEFLPRPVKELEARPTFTADFQGSRFVGISWLKADVRYNYKTVYTIDGQEMSVQATCFKLKCSVALYTEGCDMCPLSFYIIARSGGCELPSRVWRYELDVEYHNCEGLALKTFLYYIPRSPSRLNIAARHRRVTLSWQDTIDWEPPSCKYTYNCTQGYMNPPNEVTPENRRIILSDKDIRPYIPYEECTFCVSVQEYKCGGWSAPLCNRTRLLEERPRGPPTITCSSETCPAVYDDRLRNLTVTWQLPARESWGGILRKLIVTVEESYSRLIVKELEVTNLSSNTSVVTGLSKSQDYNIYLQACNRKGCSGRSEGVRIFSVREPLTPESQGTNIRLVVGGSSAGFLLLLVLLAAAAVFRRYYWRTIKSRVDLESLNEREVEADYEEILEQEHLQRYGKVDDNDNNFQQQLSKV